MSHHASPGPVGNRLDRPVDPDRDHVLGPVGAEITLVEYGSYDCQFCRTANSLVKQLRDRFGERMRYVFRHRPLPGSDIARRAAELIETSPTPEAFWRAHVTLMTRSERLTEGDLEAVAADLAAARAGAEDPRTTTPEEAARRVEADEVSASRSGVRLTPTFFINGKRYGSVWEESALADAMLGSLGHRVAAAAVDFARWAPSAGLMLVVATILAVFISNSSAGSSFLAFWDTTFSIGFGDHSFGMPLVRWINDGLLSIFFLVVGLEIKREFTTGHLASRRSAALPVAAALGGMLGPILIYLSILPDGPWSHGWGVPMATDTAFAVALIIMMGDRVPIELRVFLTAATIIDDIGAILVVAAFYSESINAVWLITAGGLTTVLFLFNRFGIYRVTPYLLVGAILWFAVHEAGLHATLAGVILAL
ncbi:MAG TPA: Na+/H+ antiporter NhaA, partial [Gemmatimonadales bacterium]|nr:Na+/H+ antiporter NhaA [Gemmatimonadales bacterium]